MQSQPDPDISEYAEIAESVRSGEYFRKARAMYDFSVHDLMTERYLYMFITGFALLIFIIAFVAMRSLYPLSTPVPFVFYVNDYINDIPRIHPLIERQGEDPSLALLDFFVKNYVTMREEYDIATFDRDRGGVESQSSPAALAEYRREVNPANPDSPLAMYQRIARRKVTIISARLREEGREAEVMYETKVEGAGKTQQSRWQANIAFQYSGLALDQKTGKVSPVKFVVTRYHTQRLQDIR